MPTNHTITIDETLASNPEEAYLPRRPTCCDKAKGTHGGIWWEPVSRTEGHQAGWTMLRNVVIQLRSYWLQNVEFCPHCGTRLSG